ncbi:hypothetical protein HMF8227_00172 [Saliniradius amylolyticus]|uniref:Carboxymuconolactone decarboxylase-like domain-containing protein n=1 Tax=Saliniradius amylolyticus TaxID=2183582 RepID=A0A2S2E079_9ALTE|nr:carboxymuconolactone decarboxylase family protein [Saliniradius amylolyticus]AWL10680.1 hypothetical protein HMF8227_00172 [Saliniradius amylolyticus]
MTDFTLHDIQSAPEAAQPLLKKSQDAFGMIPNLHAVMAEAPGLLEGYQLLHQRATESSFDKDELTVVWQSINVEHACHYCVPAHTGIAKNMEVSDELIDALRDEKPLPSDELEILRDTTLALVRDRGHLSDSQLDTFFGAGFNKRQLLEIVMILSQKVMSNYVNHLAETPLDKPFEQFEWHKS